MRLLVGAIGSAAIGVTGIVVGLELDRRLASRWRAWKERGR